MSYEFKITFVTKLTMIYNQQISIFYIISVLEIMRLFMY